MEVKSSVLELRPCKQGLNRALVATCGSQLLLVVSGHGLRPPPPVFQARPFPLIPTRTSTLRHATDHKSTLIIFVLEIKGSKFADVYPTDSDGRWRPEDFVVETIFEDPLDCEFVEIFW